MKTDYSDLLDLPHHVSDTHPRLSMEQRAAQFMPFAALTGFGDSIMETADRTITAVLEDEKCRFNPEHEFEPDSETDFCDCDRE